ncbi:MAG: hypothetical protein KJ645_02070, partial [Planctomycetes bacterium]|nr:hypothetical protein [Planctomycetota bacterium]
MGMLLAVDVGLRTGLALYNSDGKLQWYRSRKLSNTAKLKRISYLAFNEIPDLEWLVLEGGGPLAGVWRHEALRRGLRVLPTCA